MNMPHIPLQQPDAHDQRDRLRAFHTMLVAIAVAFTCGLVVGMALMTWGPQ